MLVSIPAALSAILATLVAVGPARAEPILPVGEVAAVIHQPAGALGGELGGGWAMRVDAGIGRGRFALTLPLEVGAFDPRRPERDSQHLVALGAWLALAATWSWPLGEARTGFALEARVERASVGLPGAGTVRGPLVAVGLSVWLAPALAH